MTTTRPVQITVTRSSLRAAISSVLPHTGKATEDTPRLGVMRWTMTGHGLLIWATDYNTTACARVNVVDHATDELASWYTTTAVARKILAIFKASSTRSEDGDLVLELSREQLHLTEDGGLIPGEHLKVPRTTVPEKDEYPDVARILHTALTAPLTRYGHAFVDWDHLASFAPSLRAWGSKAHLAVVDGDRPSLLVRAGTAFVGTVQRDDGTGDATRQAEERLDDRTKTQMWADELDPLRRPVKVKLTPFQEESLTEQALAALAEAGPGTHFRVVPEPAGEKV